MAARPTADLFPATLDGPRTYTRVRVLIFDDVVRVYREGPTLAETLAPTSVDQQTAKVWTFTTSEGEWTATKKGGCGCGSTLRRSWSRLPAE